MTYRPTLQTVAVAAAAALLVPALFFGGGSDDHALLGVALTALFVAGAAVIATLAGLLPGPRLDRAGMAVAFLLGGFVLWSGLSTWWSLAPDLSWNLFNRELAYLGFSVAGAYVAAVVPLRTIASWVAVALCAVVAWALLGKVFPSLVADGEHVARLRSPVGYWNALALLCAVALLLGLWLASDEGRGRAARAAGTLLVYGALVAVVLTYSRSALVIAALAAIGWLAAGRAAFDSLVALLLAGAAAAPVLVYAFLSPGVTDDGQPYSVRAHDGALFAPVLLAAGAAVVVGALWLLRRRRPRADAQRRAVRVAGLALAVAVVAVVVALVVRAGGPGPFFEARWHEFSSSKLVPSDQKGRFASLSSNHRWMWWNEAWTSFEDAPGQGRGAGTFPIVNRLERTIPITVTQPHNLYLQALSDTGIVGFLLLLGAAVAAGLAAVAAVRRARGPDRPAVLVLALAGGAYLVQSLVDVDWDFVAVSSLLFFVLGALLVRGRGQMRAAPLWALGASLGAAAAATSLLLPWLSAEKTSDASAASLRGAYAAAAADARSASSLNPLAVEPLWALGLAESLRGHLTEAQRAYARAVRLQPDNPETWYELGLFEQESRPRAGLACAFFTRSAQLDPNDPAAERHRESACS